MPPPEPAPEGRSESAAWFGRPAILTQITSGVVLRGLLFVAIFSLAAVPPLDPDLWWHLANGRLIIATGSIPHVDVYSFSAAGQPWVMHEWLADLGMYGLFRLGGLPLLVGVFAAVVTASAGCLFWLLRRSGVQPAAAVVLTLIGALAGSTAWGARPQLLNVLFAGVLMIGLLRYRDGQLRSWMLPPYIWVWANLHSGFVVGVIIGGLFVAGEAIDIWRASPQAMPRPRLLSLAVAIAASIPLSVINPFGIATLLFAVGTLTSPLIQNNIQEWASPDFHSLAGLLFEGLVFLMLAGLATRRVALRSSEWVLAFALLYLAFSSQRHVPLFVLCAAPLYGRCAQALLALVASLPNASNARIARKRGSPGPAGAPRRGRVKLGGNPLLGLVNLVVLLVVGAGMVGDRAMPNLQPATEAAAISGALPVHVSDALASLGRPVRVFNYYDYGGYLVWRLFPSGGRVYIDGRVEVYGTRIFANYLQVNYVGDGWRSVIAQARPDAILLPTGHPLVRLLQQDAEWQQFSRDPVSTVFIRVGFAP
ncbi:MAG TPA: hypothetical protein VFR68_03315 [Candidatus Dormibacteraeota bacterium]|nr:hypothetical protein [Candidatus Dormibacteraeota bacterium]